jgi:hypothetical protein
MPIAAFIPAIIAAGASIGTAVASNKAQGGAANRALQYQTRADDQTFRMEQAREAELKRQWDIQQANLLEQQTYGREQDTFNKQRLIDRDARAAPYREASLAALARMPALMGSGQQIWRSPSNAGRGTLADLARR